MKKIFLITFILLQVNQALARSNLTLAGDITQVLVPVAGIGIATYKDDKEGQKQFIKSFIVNTGLLFALKYAFKNTEWGTRPNGGKYSFPSGHSAAAFQGAFFLNKRYGLEYGAPAMIVAGFTGYTRARGNYHHWRDVFGGAALAFGVTHFMVSKYNDKVQIHTDVRKDQAMLDLKVNF